MGWTKVTAVKPRKRLIVAASGREGTGKTTYGLSAPDPIGYVSLDRNYEGVLDKAIQMGKNISMIDLKRKVVIDEDLSKNQVIDIYDRMWNGFKEAYMDALAGTEFRSIVIDTETQLYEMARLAHFGKLTQVLPHNYGPLNDDYLAVVEAARDYDKNVIFLQRTRKQYVGSDRENEKWNGKYEPAGHSQLQFKAMVNLTLTAEGAEDDRVHIATIDKCTANDTIVGREYSSANGECDFASIAADVYPEYYSLSDWLE